MAQREQQELPLLGSLGDIENMVFTRVVARGAELERQGCSLTDEDVGRLWREEVQELKKQMQQQAEKKRAQLRRWLRFE